MPTHQAVVNLLTPKTEEKVIPTRIVNTRSTKTKAAAAPAAETQNGNQPNTAVSDAAAVSAPAEEAVKLSPQLSALARKEQAFRQREQVLKQREIDLAEKLAKADLFDQLKTKMGAKDFSEAEKLGLNYDEYVQYKLAQANGDDPQAEKFKTLEQQIEALKKGQEESAEQQFEETKAAYKQEITTLVASDPEFSSVKELKREDAVLQLILDSWEEDNEELTVRQACTDIENFLIEQGKSFADLSKLKPKAPAEEARQLPPPKVGVKTLTNNMQPPANEQKPATSLQYLSESERYAEARRRVLARRQQQG